MRNRLLSAVIIPHMFLCPVLALSQSLTLSDKVRSKYKAYLENEPNIGYRAFAVDPAGQKSASSLGRGWPETATRFALFSCRKAAGRACEVYAIGDIVVLDREAWQLDIAHLLYQVKRDATAADLDRVIEKGGDAAFTQLRTQILFAAARRGPATAVEAMLDRGVGVDAMSSAGSTALAYASSRGRADTVALLLDRGADVNWRNPVGRTPLALARHGLSFAAARNYRVDQFEKVIAALEAAGGRE